MFLFLDVSNVEEANRKTQVALKSHTELYAEKSIHLLNTTNAWGVHNTGMLTYKCCQVELSLIGALQM